MSVPFVMAAYVRISVCGLGAFHEGSKPSNMSTQTSQNSLQSMNLCLLLLLHTASLNTACAEDLMCTWHDMEQIFLIGSEVITAP